MLKNLFTPIFIGKMPLKNRLVIPPMVTNYCTEDGMATDQLVRYFEARAKGGWGLMITANFAVTPNGRGWKYNGGIWSDDHIAPLKKVADAVHAHGGKIAMQLYHAGRETTADILGESPVAPSPIKDPVMPDAPRELTTEEVDDLVFKFGDAARRGQLAGFDACEIHCAHGYLIDTFLSPFSNKRTDKYGGTIWNRTRFVRDIIKDVKSRTGNDYPVLCRISSHELVSGGLTIEDTKAIALILEEAGVDAIHSSFGVFKTGSAIAAPVFERHGSMTDYAAQIRNTVSIPVIAVGRINDPFLAEAVLASGKADLIAMGRGSLADPELPNKAREGRFDEIIRCIGCREGCSGQLFLNHPIGCALNPLTGREKDYAMMPAAQKQNVLVMGGGIAGMQAAIVAAQRGHNVSIYEKSGKLGGQWLLAAIPPNKEELNAFTVWQKAQLEKLQIPVYLNHPLTKQDVEKMNPDTVIVATGAKEIIPDEFNTYKNTLTSVDILSGKVVPGTRVAVIGSGSVAAETANHLAAHNHDVTLLIRRNALLNDYEDAVREYLLVDMEHNHVRILVNASIESYDDKVLRIVREGQSEELGLFDSIVYAVGYERVCPFDETNSDIRTIVVGDAKNVRNALAAVKEGYEAGLTV
ncbi:MAG: FAD-dependent oxidoreductase [Spartobacteria bacterium]|nr:FAD-dependent oxidoreductase [Spartobacteria bacterium]